VHGHIHQNPSPEGRYINMSVEAINYTPVDIEDIAERAKLLLN
jgi:calcineurin-like phosphoesterase family protein